MILFAHVVLVYERCHVLNLSERPFGLKVALDPTFRPLLRGRLCFSTQTCDVLLVIAAVIRNTLYFSLPTLSWIVLDALSLSFPKRPSVRNSGPQYHSQLRFLIRLCFSTSNMVTPCWSLVAVTNNRRVLSRNPTSIRRSRCHTDDDF